jgi:hypothetical protein
MRKYPKYKYYKNNKIGAALRFPVKIFNFKRTKWQAITKKQKENSNLIYYKNNRDLIKNVRIWKNVKQNYSSIVDNTRYFKTVYDCQLNVKSYINKLYNKNNRNEYSNYKYISSLYRIDFLLYNLNFYDNLFDIHKSILNGNIYLNDAVVMRIIKVKKGDIIKLNSKTYFNIKSLNNIMKLTLSKKNILSYIEIDYYSGTIVITKNLQELNSKDSSIIYNYSK